MLQVEKIGSIAWLTLNRPEKANALSVGLNRAIAAAGRMAAETLQ
jgi:enoyl-CoA hydratase/carnithine racemase